MKYKKLKKLNKVLGNQLDMTGVDYITILLHQDKAKDSEKDDFVRIVINTNLPKGVFTNIMKYVNEWVIKREDERNKIGQTD